MRKSRTIPSTSLSRQNSLKQQQQQPQQQSQQIELDNQLALINQQEANIRNNLKELQVLVKNCQQVRSGNEGLLNTINKLHEKIKKETSLSLFYRKKLNTLYTNGVEDADNEIKSIKLALDTIKDIRRIQSEIHLIKSNIENQNRPKSSMRRGVLMNILQQAALTLPLWIGDIGQTPPALCGCLPQTNDYICKQGNKVAAKVKSSENNEENWILAEVVLYQNGKYTIDDIDSEVGEERYILDKSLIVPLPLWRANPLTDPQAIFQKESIVLALYPQTTCFYRGIVHESPQTPHEDYLILFEDSSYLEGYSPPLNVAQLYVVAFKEIE
jgi:SAGA-associated factor 29